MGILTAQITITELSDGVDGESPWLVTISPNELSILTDIYGDDPVFDLYEMLVQVAGPEERIPYIRPSQLIPQNVTVGGVTTSDGITFAYTPSPGILKISSMVNYQPITNRVFEVYGDDKFTEYLGKTSLVIRLDRIAVGGLSCTLSNQYQEILCDSDGAVIGELDAKTLVQVKYGNETLTHVPAAQSGRDPGKREFKVISTTTKGCTVSNTEGLISLTSLTAEQASVDITISTYFGDTATVTFNVVKKLKPEGAFNILLESLITEVVVDTAGKVTSDQILYNWVTCTLGGKQLEPFLGDDVLDVTDNEWYIASVDSDAVPVLFETNQIDADVRNMPVDAADIYITVVFREQQYYTLWRIIKKYPGDAGKTGPSLIYYGEYDKTVKLPYTVQEGTRIIVKYKPGGGSASYRITPIDWTGTIPEGTLITNTTYWTFFGNNFTSVATEILFAENAYIDVLESNNIFVGGQDTGGWVITGENGGEIYHTKTGLKLTADGNLVSPPGGIKFTTADPQNPTDNIEDIIKDFADNAVNDLDISSRNLVRYTDGQQPINWWSNYGKIDVSVPVLFDRDTRSLQFYTYGGWQAYVSSLTVTDFPTEATGIYRVEFQYKVKETPPSGTYCRLTNTTAYNDRGQLFTPTTSWQKFVGVYETDNTNFGFIINTPDGSDQVILEVRELIVVSGDKPASWTKAPEDSLIFPRNYVTNGSGLFCEKQTVSNQQDFWFRTSDNLIEDIPLNGYITISADLDLVDHGGYDTRQTYILVAFLYKNASGVEYQHDCSLQIRNISFKGRAYGVFKTPAFKMTGYKYRLVSMRPGMTGTVSNIMVQVGRNISDYQLSKEETSYLTEAFKGSTTINGGAILTNTLQLFPLGADTNDLSKVSAGMAGSQSTNHPAFWAGGNYQQAKDRQSSFGVDYLGNAWLKGDITANSGRFGCFEANDQDCAISDSDGNAVQIFSPKTLQELIPSGSTQNLSIAGQGLSQAWDTGTALNTQSTTRLLHTLGSTTAGYVGEYRLEFDCVISEFLETTIVSGTETTVSAGVEVFYKILTSNNEVVFDSRSQERTYLEDQTENTNTTRYSKQVQKSIKKNHFFMNHKIEVWVTYGAQVRCMCLGCGDNIRLDLDVAISNARLVSTTKKCIYSPDGIHFQYDGNRLFQINVNKSSSNLYVLAGGLPTSSSGLDRNQLYRNGNYIMVNNPTTLEEGTGFNLGNDDPKQMRDDIDQLQNTIQYLETQLESQKNSINLLLEKIELINQNLNQV